MNDRVGVVILAASVLIGGCVKRLGTGGTGETVISRQILHDIERADLQHYASATPPQTAPATRRITVLPQPLIRLTLAECRLAALQNNLDLKVELYNPTIAHTLLTQEQAAFEATLNAAVNYTQSKAPAAGGIPSFTQYNVGPDVNVQLPLETGGFLKLDAPFQFINNLGVHSSLNPSYTFTPNITFNQPLLRGFGFDINAQAIRIAFYQYQQAQTRTKLEVIRVLAVTDRAYWRLYAGRALLDVRQKQYDLAVAQLERARRQAKQGVVAEVDIVRAESAVADQVEQIILAENQARQRERELKRILARPDLGMETVTQVIPATRPDATAYRLDPNRLVAAALNQRMELLEIELQVLADTASIRFARNQMLPLLALQYTYSHNGYAASASGALDQVWNKQYEGHNLSLVLSFPIGNESARSQLRRSLLSRLQQLATREQRTQQIRQEVFDATDNFHTDWERIVAAHKRVELAQRVLEVEIRQFNAGLRTSTEVTDAEARLADAQSSEISAITDYQITQVDIAVATGTVLGASRVHWQEAGQEVERSVR